MSYHEFKDEDGTEYGSFEVFYHYDPSNVTFDDSSQSHFGMTTGWHWWACFPGCLPDGDPAGPFDSEQAAIEDGHNG